MRLFALISVGLVALGLGFHLSKAEAGPTGCRCTSWALPADTYHTAGAGTCSGCPTTTRCAPLRAYKELRGLPIGVLDGSPRGASTCIMSGDIADRYPYESVREACEHNNWYFYYWDPQGGRAYPNCHFGGYGRESSSPFVYFDYGLPWCYSKVDLDGSLTGIASGSTLAISFAGAPGWRSSSDHHFEAYAENAWGEFCFNGKPYTVAPIAWGPLRMGPIRAMTEQESIDAGIATAGTSVHAGFCFTSRRGFKTIAKHSCAYLDFAD